MFAHLRNHSHYSLLSALPKIDPLVSKAKTLGMSSLALTDYNNMYGTIEFYKACEKEKIKPIIGVEYDLKYEERTFKIVLIARNLVGYKNLMRITSLINVEDPLHPVLTQDILL
ncbi:MAG: PHP domain-containing protein, partial [Candidatus Paceibacterota bacterium]